MQYKWTKGNCPWLMGEYTITTTDGKVCVDFYDGVSWKSHDAKEVIAYTLDQLPPFRGEVPFHELGLTSSSSSRILRFLQRELRRNDVYAEDFCLFDAKTLLSEASGIGERMLDEIREKLRSYGLYLKGEDPAEKVLRVKNVKGFVLYRIYYGNEIVYVGRTKQALNTRLRGHVFGNPMQRTIDIEKVSKIEYAMLKTEADMNLYEIYYILKLHPARNVDDKASDNLTFSLPDLDWREHMPPLWEKWRRQIREGDRRYSDLNKRLKQIQEEMSIAKSQMRRGTISEDQCYERLETLAKEKENIKNVLSSGKLFTEIIR